MSTSNQCKLNVKTFLIVIWIVILCGILGLFHVYDGRPWEEGAQTNNGKNNEKVNNKTVSGAKQNNILQGKIESKNNATQKKEEQSNKDFKILVSF